MKACGIERIGQYPRLFAGKRLGLVTTSASVDRGFASSVEILSERCRLTALYSPEHGLRGEIDAGMSVDSYVDKPTGLRVHSLYRGDARHLGKEMIEGIDLMVFDIQDLGLRFYTYIATLKNLMEDCAGIGLPLVVLDRPNPLGGEAVEGNILGLDSLSFVGPHPLPIRYGLTIGELAGLFASQCGINCDLSVVPMSGWRRRNLFDELGRNWMMTSPALGHFSGALLYAGMCLFEGTNLSEGRGTSCPFELIGAPFIDAESLCREARGLGLPGIKFTPAYFTPAASKHAGKLCSGIYSHVTDKREFRPVETAVRLIALIQKLYPGDFRFLPPYEGALRPPFANLAGTGTAEALVSDAVGLLDRWKADSESFSREKKQYHLYR